MAEYINRQTAPEVKDLRWGLFSKVGRGGCGAVAAYNVAVALGKNPDFRALVREFEKKHMASVGGLCGMNVFRLHRWLKKRYGRAELHLPPASSWEEKTRFCRAVVVFYKNRGIFRGNHFIAGARGKTGFTFHNAPALGTAEIGMEKAVEALKRAGNTPIFLIVL